MKVGLTRDGLIQATGPAADVVALAGVLADGRRMTLAVEGDRATLLWSGETEQEEDLRNLFECAECRGNCARCVQPCGHPMADQTALTRCKHGCIYGCL